VGGDVTENDTLRLVGRTIADKYAVEKLVGEGGFATVYRATHLIWKRPVALKVFKAMSDFSAKDRQRLLDEFIQEGALLADLSARSAAIVQARDIGMLDTPKGDQIPYMVLEWLEGATLEGVLSDERTRRLPLRSIGEAVRLLDPAAEALALAHRKGIAHRDVKPGNIFVLGDPRGEATVKLLDFGIAKVVSDAQKMAGTFTKTGGQVTSFTPVYGAPEQFSRTHGATGPWTDVFALALIGVEVITGREGLEGEDFVQLAVSSARPDRRPTPRTLGASVNDGVEAAFAKALAVKPSDRWQSAGDFWQALRLALGLEPMTKVTDPTLRSRAVVGPAEPIATAPTMAAVSSDPSATAALTKTTDRTTTGRGAGSGRMGLFVALGVAAVAAIGAGVHTLRPKSTSATASAPAVSSAAASAAALPEAPACPSGMIHIPGGSFFMGSDDGLQLEKPAHQVTLAPYCIDRFEVTVEDYKACSDAGRCKRAGTANAWASITDKERKAFDPLCNARDPAMLAKHPINCVDWEMAEKFCGRPSQRLRSRVCGVGGEERDRRESDV
jgi:serine/threonine protein kinase